jgi:hypothetical protein
MLRRNSIEGILSQLKRRGIGNSKHFNCRWITRQAHMEWLCGSQPAGADRAPRGARVRPL